MVSRIIFRIEFYFEVLTSVNKINIQREGGRFRKRGRESESEKVLV